MKLVTDERIEVGKRIKAIRVNKGMSLDEVAMLLGYKSPSSISKWECGVQKVPDEKREDLADALDSSVSEIFAGQTVNVKANAKAKVKVPVNSTMDGQIWEIKSPAGQMQMLILAESRDVVTGLLLVNDNDGNKTYPIGDKWVDVTVLTTKPKTYLCNKSGDVDKEVLSKVKELIRDYLKIEPEVVVQEKLVKDDTTALERQVLELKAKLYDLMTA